MNDAGMYYLADGTTKDGPRYAAITDRTLTHLARATTVTAPVVSLVS